MKIKRISFVRIQSRFGDRELGNLKDMLRYDTAFQWTRDPAFVAFPVFHTKDGNLGGRITHGRWDSFGVRVLLPPWNSQGRIPSVGHLMEEPTIHDINMNDWVSYRHPRSENGPFDYTRLVPVTLAEYQAAKDTEELAVEKELQRANRKR